MEQVAHGGSLRGSGGSARRPLRSSVDERRRASAARAIATREAERRRDAVLREEREAAPRCSPRLRVPDGGRWGETRATAPTLWMRRQQTTEDLASSSSDELVGRASAGARTRPRTRCPSIAVQGVAVGEGERSADGDLRLGAARPAGSGAPRAIAVRGSSAPADRTWPPRATRRRGARRRPGSRGCCRARAVARRLESAPPPRRRSTQSGVSWRKKSDTQLAQSSGSIAPLRLPAFERRFVRFLAYLRDPEVVASRSGATGGDGMAQPTARQTLGVPDLLRSHSSAQSQQRALPHQPRQGADGSLGGLRPARPRPATTRTTPSPAARWGRSACPSSPPRGHGGALRRGIPARDDEHLDDDQRHRGLAARALRRPPPSRQGVDPRGALRGTTQNDIIKEYLSRGTYIFPPEPSLRLISDMVAYSVDAMPKWNPINVCSYHLQEAGATPAQEIAYSDGDGVRRARRGARPGRRGRGGDPARGGPDLVLPERGDPVRGGGVQGARHGRDLGSPSRASATE